MISYSFVTFNVMALTDCDSDSILSEPIIPNDKAMHYAAFAFLHQPLLIYVIYIMRICSATLITLEIIIYDVATILATTLEIIIYDVATILALWPRWWPHHK